MVCQGTPNSGVPVPPPCPAAGEEGYVSSIGDRVGGAMGAGNGVVKDEMAGYLQPMLVIVLTFSSRAKMSSY